MLWPMHEVMARTVLSPNVTRLVVEAARIAEVRQAASSSSSDGPKARSGSR